MAANEKAKPSAVWTREQLRSPRGAVERGSAWVLLGVSLIGSVVALAGGWDAVLVGRAAIGGGLFGLLLQAVLTWLEWAYADMWPLAWGARLVDAGLTAWGFGPLFAAGLNAMLVSNGASAISTNMLGFIVSPALLGTWAIIYLVSLAIAWYPESRLID